jgi:hypothetical protein
MQLTSFVLISTASITNYPTKLQIGSLILPQLFQLSPSDDDGGPTTIISVPELPSKVDLVLWDLDLNCRHVFIVYPANSVKVWLYSAWRELGRPPSVTLIGRFDILKFPETRPLCLRKGSVYAFLGSGKITKSISLYDERQGEDGLSHVKRLSNLRLFQEAHSLCRSTQDDKSKWEQLGTSALNAGCLEIGSYLLYSSIYQL